MERYCCFIQPSFDTSYCGEWIGFRLTVLNHLTLTRLASFFDLYGHMWQTPFKFSAWWVSHVTRAKQIQLEVFVNPGCWIFRIYLSQINLDNMWSFLETLTSSSSIMMSLDSSSRYKLRLNLDFFGAILLIIRYCSIRHFDANRLIFLKFSSFLYAFIFAI